MKAIVLIFCALGILTGQSSELKDYRWKNRVILVDGVLISQLKLSEAEQEAVKDRDLVILQASEKQRVKFGIQGKEPTFILIGKDGGEKSRQTGKLELWKWFLLIDQMPMRQREMRD